LERTRIKSRFKSFVRRLSEAALVETELQASHSAGHLTGTRRLRGPIERRNGELPRRRFQYSARG
jgi:hypothetical protein